MWTQAARRKTFVLNLWGQRMASQFFAEMDLIKMPVPPLRLGLVVRGREEKKKFKTEVPSTFPGRARGLGSSPTSIALSFATLQKWAAGRTAAFLRPQAAFLSQRALIYVPLSYLSPGPWWWISPSAFGEVAQCQEYSPEDRLRRRQLWAPRSCIHPSPLASPNSGGERRTLSYLIAKGEVAFAA